MWIPTAGEKADTRHIAKPRYPGTLKFTSVRTAAFYPVLKKRVDAYFEKAKVSRHANGKMIRKTVFILGVYFLTYGLLLSNWFSPWALLGIAIVHGFFTALIGLNITHDAMHGAYSTNRKVNHLIGLFFNLIGANDFMWKISHNYLHHSFTNVAEHDADIDQIPIIRLHPHQERWWIHRFQYVYIFFFYALTSLAWVFARDFLEFFHPKVDGVNRSENPRKEFLRMLGFKVIYYIFFLIIPLMVIELPWYYILLGFVIMHLVEGITLALIFQLAHVIEGTEYPLPDADGKLENSWAEHQMYTTANFACGNKFVNYICGGLNFQVEHHLFPNICHVHYDKLAPIVEQTAKEFNLPYIHHPTYFGALGSHIRVLKEMGRA